MSRAGDRIAVLHGHIGAHPPGEELAAGGRGGDGQGPVTPSAVAARHEGRALPSTWRRAAGHGVAQPEAYTPVVRTAVDPGDASYQRRYRHNAALCEELQRRISVARLGGGGKAEALQRGRGKNLVRTRVQKIIDEGTEFMEFSPLAAWGLFGGDWHSGGLVTGIGIVAGRECVFICNDPTIKGGTFANPAGGKKMARAQDISMVNHLPCIWLVDGGGAKLDAQAGPPPSAKQAAKAAAKKDGGPPPPPPPPPRDRSFEGALPAAFVMGGTAFYKQMRMSSMGIPQIAVTCGGATAGSAYFVALTEENIIVETNGSVYLGGPPLVKAATGEDADNESLGGAKMHTTVSGTVDHYAANEDAALALCRQAIENFGRRHPRLTLPNLADPEPPKYDPDGLLGIIPEDTGTPYDIREVIARIVDGSRLHEFKPGYGAALVCGWAHIEGYPVGIVASNGLLSNSAVTKATHFVQICGQRVTPLVFFHNARGFEYGTKAEEGGLVKNTAKMIAVVANVPVPKFSVICGDSYGPASFAMCGPALGPRLTFSWPSAKVAAMSSENFADVHAIMRQEQLEEEGKAPMTSAEVADFKKPLVDNFEARISAWQSTAWVCDDGLIDPRDTRKSLANAISISLNAPLPGEGYGALRI